MEMDNYINSFKLDSVSYKNTIYLLYTYEIIYNNLKNNNGKWYFKDLYDHTLHEVYNFICIHPDTVIFFFNKQNPTFIVISQIYREIGYIGYVNQELLIKINTSTSGFSMIEPTLVNNFSYLTTMSKNSGHLSNKQNICFGFVSNVGHHVWNEISGLLLFLKYPDNFKNINNIYIGQYDIFNIKKYLIENYNFKIVDNNNDTYLCKTEIPIFLSSFIINHEDTINLFNKLFDFDYYSLVNSYENNLFELSIDIRTCSRNLINITDIYKNLINMLDEKYKCSYKLKIYFIGIFETNVFKINKENTDYIKQNVIVTDILNSINNKNIIYENLIGKPIQEIFKKLINIKFSITIGGTSISNLLNWIYKKNVIGLCGTTFYSLVNDIQYDCLKNFNVFVPPIEYISDIGSDFCIKDIDKFNIWFINKIETFEN